MEADQLLVIFLLIPVTGRLNFRLRLGFPYLEFGKNLGIFGVAGGNECLGAECATRLDKLDLMGVVPRFLLGYQIRSQLRLSGVPGLNVI